MAVNYNPSTITNGLVLVYDIGNGIKNSTGNINTNLVQNGNFVGGANSLQEGGSNPTNTIVQFPNPGDTAYVLRQNGNNTEYQLNLGTGMTANTTYVMSGWYAKSTDYNGGDTMFHARTYSSSGAHIATGTGTGILIYSTVVNGIVWEFRYQTIATPADFTGSMLWFVGYGTNNTTGYRYYTNLRVEKGTYPSIFNLIGGSNNGECQNGLSYNNANGGSLVFDGADDYVNLGSFFNYQTFTIELWVNPGATQTTYADIFDNSHTGTQNFVLQQNGNDVNNYAFGVNDGSGNISATGTIVLTANTWTHLAFTFSPSTRVSAYVNGALHSQGALANGRTINYVNQSLALGRWQYAGARHWNGKISTFKVYNSILIAPQILQNFNATRGRFGI